MQLIRTILAAIIAIGLGATANASPLQQNSDHRFAPPKQLVTGWGNQRGHRDNLPSRLLTAHNRERARVGAAPLSWDPTLAAAAASYGPYLESVGALRHSPRASRPGTSENLWKGTRGYYSPEAMVGTWIEEINLFRPGIFPNNSKTGNWADVGHYTLLIWPSVTKVGCAVHRSAQWDYLICRYSPKGNIDGKYLHGDGIAR